MQTTIKESFLLKNIQWMMPKIDLVSLCQRMGWKIHSETSEHIITYCPDHALHTGREPSHPKFYINKSTGQTYCQTEGRGSNIFWTIKRLSNRPSKEIYSFMTGEEIEGFSDVSLSVLKGKIDRLSSSKKEEDFNLEADNYAQIRAGIEEAVVYESGYNYFMYPPGKKPTLISRETVNHFKVFQQDFGYYKNRVIVPVFLKDTVTGFVAIDILGETEWLNQNPGKDAKTYKKVLYPKGFKSGSNLFNYDGLECAAKYVILVEGVRDAMKLWQMGFTNVAAIFGLNISHDQIKLLSQKYPEYVYLMFDGDDKGYEATSRVGKKLSTLLDVKAVITPRGHDPKTITREKMISCIQNVQNV